MSRSDRDPTTVVRSWLEEGADRIPDRVLDAVEAQLSATRQRRRPFAGLAALLSPGGRAVFAGLALLAVLAASIIGTLDVGVPEPPSRTATPSPSPTPIPSGAIPLPFSGDIEAGSYFVADALPAAVLTIDDGPWRVFNDYAGDLCRGNCDPPAGSGIGIWTVVDVYEDSCRPQDGRRQPALGPSVDDLVAALVAQQPEAPPVVTDVVIDGHPGKRLSLVAPAEAAQCSQGMLWRWIDAGGTPRHGLPGEHDELWVLDVDGQRVVVDVIHFASTPPQDLETLVQAAESVRFHP